MPGPETRRLYDAAARLKIGFGARILRTRGRRRPPTPFQYHGPRRTGRRLIGRYRKMHVPGSSEPSKAQPRIERRYFEPGNLGFPAFDYCGVRVGMAICNDRRWPETYRMPVERAEVVLLGYNTPLLFDEAPALAHLRMFHNHSPMQAGVTRTLSGSQPPPQPVSRMARR